MYLPKFLDRYFGNGNGRWKDLEGYKGALSVRDVGIDDVYTDTSTGSDDPVIHTLLARGPRKYLTIAVDCEGAVDFDIDFSVDNGVTYLAGNTVTISMDGAGSALENMINNRPDLTHIKVTPDRAGTYTVKSIVSNHPSETNANILVDGMAVEATNPMPVQQSFKPELMTTDTLVKTGAGVLHSIAFAQGDAAPTAGSIDVYDGVDATGTKIFSETFTTTEFPAYSVLLDFEFTTGLFVDFTTTADVNVTVGYR